MEIIIGLGLSLVLLWGWLIGHWFARVVVFLPLVVLLGAGGSNVVPLAPFVGLVAGIALAWPIASLPIYIRRGVFQRLKPAPAEPHWAANPAPIKLTLR